MTAAIRVAGPVANFVLPMGIAHSTGLSWNGFGDLEVPLATNPPGGPVMKGNMQMMIAPVVVFVGSMDGGDVHETIVGQNAAEALSDCNPLSGAEAFGELDGKPILRTPAAPF